LVQVTSYLADRSPAGIVSTFSWLRAMKMYISCSGNMIAIFSVAEIGWKTN